MDYEFTKQADGRLRVKLAMGHEAFGHWLNDAIATNLTLLADVLLDVERVQQGEVEMLTLHSAGYTLQLGDGEAEISANVVQFEFGDELEPDMAYYDDEQMSGCGLEDFQRLLLAWQDFVQSES
jgi:uncharacterized protein YacL (UPF0231 family)